MNELATAREALLAEAIGDLSGLVDRLDAVAPAIDASREALVRSAAGVAQQVSSLEARMAGIVENAKTVAARHMALRADELARSASEAQTRAMEEAARALFRTELGPALQRLAVPVNHLADRCTPLGERWLAHAATAVLASALSWALAAWLWVR